MTRQEAEAISELRQMMSTMNERAIRHEEKLDDVRDRSVARDAIVDEQTRSIKALSSAVETMQPQIDLIRSTVTAVTVGKRVLWWLGGAAVSLALTWDWLATHFAWFPQLGRGAGRG